MAVIFDEASGVANSVYGNSQAPIQLFIEKQDSVLEKESMLPNIFKMEKSSHWAEKRTGMTAMKGFLPVGENGAAPEDTMQEGFSSILVNMTWKNEFAVTEEMVEDSQLIDFESAPMSFIDGYHTARESFGANILAGAVMNGGTANTKITINGHDFSTAGADTRNFFAPDHPSITDAIPVQSNCFKDEFSEDALSYIECAMRGFKGDSGNLLNIVPDTIIIPDSPMLLKKVFAVIGADKEPTSSNNGFNYHFGRWNVILWKHLDQFLESGVTPWMVMSSKYNQNYASAVFQDRRALKIRSYIEDKTDANIWHGTARFTAGFHDWRGFAVGGVPTGSTLIGA